MQKTNVMRILEKANIVFKAYEYDSTKGIDARSVARQIEKEENQVFKTLVTQSQNKNHSFDHFVFVIPSNAELDLKKAAASAKVKNLEMLPMKNLQPLTGYIHGGCSPIGMKKVFKTFIDDSANRYERICISGGKVGFTIETSSKQLSSFINATFADLTKKG